MFELPLPSHDWLTSVFNRLWSHIEKEFLIGVQGSNKREELLHHSNLCFRMAQDALNKADSMVAFNANFISLLINQYWSLPVVFIPGHQALTLAADHFEFLWDSAGEIFRAKNEAAELLAGYGLPPKPALIGSEMLMDFWFWCHCGQRLPVLSRDSCFTTITAECEKCQLKYSYTKHQRVAFRNLVRDGRVFPRVVADNLFDRIAWGFYAGAGYVGSAEHYLFSGMVALRLGLAPLPEFLWSAEQSQQVQANASACPKSGVGSNEASIGRKDPTKELSSGRTSCLFYLSMETPANVLSTIRGFLPAPVRYS
jgi:hypothetical protein